MTILRKIFFYLFAAIFVIFAPIIVFYALGYFIQPGQTEHIVKTGLIYISSVPSDATVYLESKKFQKKTPAMIRNLLPGTYRLKINKKNYKPWTQLISVEAGKATVLNKVILFPKNWQPETNSTYDFTKLIPLPESNRILLSKGEKLSDYFVYEMSSEKTKPIIKPDFIYADSKVVHYECMPRSEYVLFEVTSSDGPKFLWINIEKNKEEIKDVSSFFSTASEHVFWDAEEPKYLFSIENHVMKRLNLNTSMSAPQFMKFVRSYGVFNKSLYVMTDHDSFVKTDLENRREEVILNDSGLYEGLFGNEESYQIKVLQDDLILFISARGALVSNRLPYHFVNEGVLDSVANEENQKILFYTKNKIGALDFTRQTQDVKIFEKGPVLSWIYEQGKSIQSVYWVYGGTHVLFQDGNDVFFLEAIPYSAYSLMPLIKVKDNSSIFYSDKFGKLFYLEPGAGKLKSLEILPKRKMPIWEIPEFEFTSKEKEPVK